VGHVLALTHHGGARLAEIGFLLILLAGVWLIAAETFQVARWQRFRIVVAGIALAVAGLLLVIATHWGRFG
jgi:hypothetical protein